MVLANPSDALAFRKCITPHHEQDCTKIDQWDALCWTGWMRNLPLEAVPAFEFHLALKLLVLGDAVLLLFPHSLNSV